MRSEALAVSQEDGDESCSIIGSTLPSMPSDAGSSEPPKPWERREFKVTPGGSDRWRLDYWLGYPCSWAKTSITILSCAEVVPMQ